MCDAPVWYRNGNGSRKGYIPGVGGVLVELPFRGEDDDGDLGVAEDGDLVRLLEQPVAALGEGHLTVYLVLYPLQLHLAATHPDRSPFDLAGNWPEAMRGGRRGGEGRWDGALKKGCEEEADGRWWIGFRCELGKRSSVVRDGRDAVERLLAHKTKVGPPAQSLCLSLLCY